MLKLPLPPPDWHALVRDADRLKRIVPHVGPQMLADYLHWDDLRHRQPPEALSPEDWWVAIKLARTPLLRRLPLTDRAQARFAVGMPDQVQELLHRVDMALGLRPDAADPLASGELRDAYLISSLMEEAITSSQLEGASTTRQVAADMLRSGRDPHDRSERMIFNNYRAMQRIRSARDEALTPAFVLELHALLTEGTLRDPGLEGRLQQPDDERVRLDRLCAFANTTTAVEGYVHPVVRAIVLHFALAYDHPFEDGNGRTARVLFYWGMLRQGYWLAEFLSISRILNAAPGQYQRAFLHSETDDNDLTYFVLQQLRVLSQAIDALHDYLKRKHRELAAIEKLLRDGSALNHRQRALLGHALRHPGFAYDIESHRRSHDVVYATARADLLGLSSTGLLQQRKVGRAFRFVVPADLERRLRKA